MKKLIIIFLVLFATSVHAEEYGFNPFTGKMDLKNNETEEIDVKNYSTWFDGPAASNTTVQSALEQLSASSTSVASGLPFQQVVTVAKSGGDYTSIQDAIDSITDNATGKRYVVLVYPGTYTENITMEDFVSLNAVGKRSDVVIDGTVTFASDAGDKTEIKGFHVNETTTTTGLDLITSPNSTGQHSIKDCTLTLKNTDNGDVGSLIDEDGGTLKIRSSKLVYNFDGTASGANLHNIIDITGTITYDIYDCEFDFDIDDEDDTVVGVNEAAAGTITESHMTDTTMHLDLNHGTYTGICGLFYLHGAGTEKYYQSNHVHLTSTGGGSAYGIYIDTTGNNGEVHTTANQIHISGFTNNYGLNVASGDTVFSHFDDVLADGGNTGAGTITAVQSPADGDLKVTGDADIDGTASAVSVHATDRLDIGSSTFANISKECF